MVVDEGRGLPCDGRAVVVAVGAAVVGVVGRLVAVGLVGGAAPPWRRNPGLSQPAPVSKATARRA